jgi:hypothetical protein
MLNFINSRGGKIPEKKFLGKTLAEASKTNKFSLHVWELNLVLCGRDKNVTLIIHRSG